MSDDRPQIDLADFVYYCADKPKGYQLAYRFVHAIDNDYTPDPADLKQLAEGFRHLLHADSPKEGLRAFAKTLDLEGKQGRKRRFGANLKEIDLVVRVMLLQREGMSQTKAQKTIAEQRWPTREPEDRLRRIKQLYKQHAQAAELYIQRMLDEQQSEQ